MIGQCVKLAAHTPKNVPAALDWEPGELDAWVNGENHFDLDRAKALAVALDVGMSLFVRRALEVSLRRDLAKVNGARS